MTATIADELLEILHHIAPDVDPVSVDRRRPMVDQLDLDSMEEYLRGKDMVQVPPVGRVTMVGG